MRLRDVIKQEFSSVFLNADEFGDILTIDGVDTIGVWSEEAVTLPGQSSDGLQDVDSFGLVADERVLYIAEGAIALPEVGQRMNIDGECWLVMPGTRADMGMLTLKLRRVYS